ncbi:hypothetical protein [Morganella psychrotolerans]|uniref:cold shock small protein YmcF n=1 Tax=Morganella psychrotolerans TaxID=368603 RepID=UPI0039A0BCD3
MWWRSKYTMMINFCFKCPCCSGSQYRTSQFDISLSNPRGAKCIFCKTAMKVEAN